MKEKIMPIGVSAGITKYTVIDQKQDFMREWMLTFAYNRNYDLAGWYNVGGKAWKLLQEIPETDDKDTDELFEFSPEE